MQITAVAAFVKNGRILLEKRKNSEDNYAGFWALPGGHKKTGESLAQTLRREMREELGVKIQKAEFLGKFKDIDPTSKKIYQHNAFLCLKWKGKIEKTREEERVKWWDLKNFKKIPHTRKVDKKILEKLI